MEKNLSYHTLTLSLLLFITVMSSPLKLNAQESEEDKNNTLLIDELVVTATSHETKVFNTSLPVTVITRERIEEVMPRDIGELIRFETGLNVSYTSMGIVFPMIRGLYGARVLVLIDGIRLSEEQPGGTHALSINPSQIERIEVVRGANSVLYGSDAIGGVINIITRKYQGLRDKKARVNGTMEGGMDSATNGWKTVAYLDGGIGGFNLFAGGTYKDTDNVETPDGELRHSYHDLYTYSGGANYIGEKCSFGIWGYISKADIGNPVNQSFVESGFEGEKHHFVMLNAEINDITETFKQLKVDAAFQRHNRHFHAVSGPVVDIYLDKDTANLNPQLTFSFGSFMRLTTGIQCFYEKVVSNREHSLVDLPGVIPDANRLGTGIFVQDEIFIIERVLLTIGVRYDWIQSETDPGWDEIDCGHPIGRENETDTNVSGSINLLIKLIKNYLHLTANAGRAFRAPTLLERFFHGPHTTFVEWGNPDLTSETSYNFDTGLKLNTKRFWFVVSGFYNRINNYIVKYDTGLDSGSQDIYSWDNLKDVEIYGGEAEAELQLFSGFSVFGNVTYVRGNDRDTDTDLPAMPPLQGTYGLRFFQNYKTTKTWFEFSAHSVADQNKVANNEAKTAGYTTFDLLCGFKFTPSVNITLYVKNLTDKSYHNHLSEVKPENIGQNEQPGRSFGGGLKITF